MSSREDKKKKAITGSSSGRVSIQTLADLNRRPDVGSDSDSDGGLFLKLGKRHALLAQLTLRTRRHLLLHFGQRHNAIPLPKSLLHPPSFPLALLQLPPEPINLGSTWGWRLSSSLRVGPSTGHQGSSLLKELEIYRPYPLHLTV
ncbi:uncharacterized protein A4U43_C06F19600 [Asparagus officinalis]|uniref:Uncharacterized protein n=1 Tax=Asparagus officinalis TaxID=4686 RepID=A0A5P1ENZ9_ASPOF|nr:uncharacterized protein A4U43_C06F19600 [Asparagus officinalis]